MKVGLTYDLKSEYLKMGFSEEETAEFDKEDTIEGIESTLEELGYKTERIGNIKQLAVSLVEGKKWDIVFNICEGMYGIGREAQVPALLDAYNIPYVFSNPLVLSLTLDKAMTKRVIRDFGLATPDFAVVNKPEDSKNVKIPLPLFAKPLGEGTGKGIDGRSVINTYDQLYNVCNDLLVRFGQAVLVEKFLSGREFTVGIVGTGENAKVVGSMEIILNEDAEKNVYSYTNKSEYEKLVEYKNVKEDIVKQSENLALAAWKALGCEDGGRIDIRCNDNGLPNFIEVNPLAGLNPIHSDLPILSRLNGISYKELLSMIMDSAIKKLKSN
ncbi:MAG: ATP-grasp domain-containing protein [Bacteroidetes bacterium]|nr:ATP-grasp domain-containing protein [Bacteroidota bacterium]